MNRQQIIHRSLQLLIILILFSSGNVFSQKRDQQKELPDATQIEKMTNKLTKEVNLNEVQQSSVLDLYTSHFEKVAQYRETYSDDRKTMKTEIKSLKTDLDESILSLLSNEQKTAYEEFKANRKQRPKNNGGSEKRSKN